MTNRLILSIAALATLVSAGPVAAAPQAGPRMTLSVWLERGGKLWLSTRTVAGTPAVAAAAVTQLFTGPNATERAAGVGSAVPAGSGSAASRPAGASPRSTSAARSPRPAAAHRCACALPS